MKHEDGGRFDAQATRQRVLEKEVFSPTQVVHYALYPFDTRWAYHTNARPIWNEPRPALAAQHWEGNWFFVTRMLAERPGENVAMMATPVLPDYHLLRPNAVAIPVRLAKQGSDNLFADNLRQTTANLSKKARAYLDALGVVNPDTHNEAAGLLWYHALAIGFAPAYTAENGDGIRSNYPRVPLPATRGALDASAALGRKVTALLDTETPVPGVTTSPVRDELKGIALLDGGGFADGDLAVTAGWGNATKTGVMPGKGKVVSQPAETGTPATLGDETLDVYLNASVAWRNVPIAVWRYTLGGYQVMKKWLSYREKSVLRRDLTMEEARDVQHMARRAAALLLLSPELDANYRAVVADMYDWPLS